MEITYIFARITSVLTSLTILLITLLAWKYHKAGIPILAKIPIIGEKYAKNIADKQIKKAEAGTVYNNEGDSDKTGENFKKFLLDLPNYCINDSWISQQVRGIFELGGAQYIQIVLIDKGDPKDKYIWVRKNGHTFIHDKGLYAYPWECIKNVLYYDTNDFRPLIDLTDEMDWKNTEMCADVVNAITNTKAMAGMKNSQVDELIKLQWYNIVASGILAILLIVVIITYSKSTEATMQILTNISQRIP